MGCPRTGLSNNFFMTLWVPARALFDFNDLGIDMKKSCFLYVCIHYVLYEEEKNKIA